jgi:hypothetical protein
MADAPKMPSIFDTVKDAAPSLIGAGASLFAGIYKYNRPNINYDILNLQADYKDTQAEQQLARATQEANVLRKQFNQAAGAYTYSAARRNVKAGEGSAAENVEMSARDMGEDIYTMRRNAEFQAGQLRGEAEMLRQGAEDLREVNEWERIGALFGGISDAATQFGAGWEVIDNYNKRAAAAREYEAAQAVAPTVTTPAASAQTAASVQKKQTKQQAQDAYDVTPLNIPQEVPTNSNVTAQVDLSQKIGKPLTEDELQKLHKESQRAAEYELHPIGNRISDAWNITKKEVSKIAANVRHNLRVAWGIKDDISNAVFEKIVKLLNNGKSVEEVAKELGIGEPVVKLTFEEVFGE